MDFINMSVSRIQRHRFTILVVILVLFGLVYFSRQSNLVTATVEKEQSAPINTIPILDKKNYKDVLSRLTEAHVPADDPTLVEIVRHHFIEPPSTLPYNLDNPEKINPSPAQSQIIDKLMKNKTGGFFIDCGAHNGEFLSNSLFHERYRSWNGILIEPNPNSYSTLKSKHRKAFTLNACLSVTQHTEYVSFSPGKKSVLGKIVPNDENDNTLFKVQCFPIYTILLAINQLTVDYFSLDVEGAELGVLDNIPWDKIDIRSISIEHNKWTGGKPALTEYMNKRGYKMVADVKGIGVAPDLIFMKRGYHGVK